MSAVLALALVALAAPQEPAAAVGPGPSGKDRAAALDAARLQACAEAADRGLRWLAANQQRSGAWVGIVGHKQSHDYHELDIGLPVDAQRARHRGHPGVTALCGMAFLAGGHLPDRGIYGDEVQRTIEYLVGCTHDDGLMTDSGTRMYSHAFATLFLAECYGMAGGAPVRQALQRAVNMIVDCQNAHGGWRYNPFDVQIDLSVTVCQLQALRAARNIGIKVPEATVERAIDYVRRSHVSAMGGSRGGYSRRGRDGFGRTGRAPGQFYYKIEGRGAYDKVDEYAINAAALTALASAGIYDPELHEPTLDFLEAEYATVADDWGQHFYFWYGNYYACQAFFQAGGPRFRTYYDRLARDLLSGQQPDGRWRNDCGPGDEFSTAVACLLLQLPRQYLPIFQR